VWGTKSRPGMGVYEREEVDKGRGRQRTTRARDLGEDEDKTRKKIERIAS